MQIHKKICWKISNRIEAFYKQTFKKGSGLLRHREDNRDFKGIGGLLDFLGIPPKTSIKELNWLISKFWFNQNPFNICVFAAFAILMSHQSGIRFSVRWLVKLAKREGYISGNGWSFLKGALKCASKYGLLPCEFMPDETDNLSWEEYSRWTDEDEKLKTEAEKYKIAEYRNISKSEGLKVLPSGYLLYTAMNWYSGMNNPQPPAYLLIPSGSFVGGHAIQITGWKDNASRFINPQTFGRWFAENGTAYISDLWGTMKYPVYMISQISMESRLAHFLKFYEGKIVRTKTDSACYMIKDGKKYGILTEEQLKELLAKIGEDKFFGEVKQDVLDKVGLGGGGDLIVQNDI